MILERQPDKAYQQDTGGADERQAAVAFSSRGRGRFRAGGDAVRRRPDRGLDALNLLLAASGALYAAFLPPFLAGHGWSQEQIGAVLAGATVAAMACQVPAGLLVDLLGRHRRAALTLAVALLAAPPLAMVAAPRFGPVLLALLAQAGAASLLTPAVAAISLAVAGRAHFANRVGRNSRYGSIGAALGALAMGLCLDLGPSSASLWLAALATLPTLMAIRAIGPDRVTLSRHGVAPTAEARHAASPGPGAGLRALLGDRRLAVFALCVAGFSLGDTGGMQIATVAASARAGAHAGLAIAAFAIVPQIVAAAIAPAVSRAADLHGRRMVLLAGFLALPLRDALFAVFGGAALVPAQMLEGFGGAIFGMMLSLVAADLTRRSGYYTLCLSLLGLASGLGAAASSALTGVVAQHLGGHVAFAVLAGCALAAAAGVAWVMPETASPPLARRRPRRRGIGPGWPR